MEHDASGYGKFLVAESFKNSPINKTGEFLKIKITAVSTGGSYKTESEVLLVPVKGLFAAVSMLSIKEGLLGNINIVVLDKSGEENVFRFIIQKGVLKAGILENPAWEDNEYLPEFVVG